MGVKIVTDSTSDLPPELATRLGITVAPLNVHFGTEMYLDGVDLSPDEFYQRLQSSSVLPTTSQPSVGAFVDLYQRLSQDADAILSIHISSLMSGTYNSAIQAKEQAEVSCPIEVVDTGQASMGLGLIAMAAAEAVQKGAGLQEAREVVESVTPYTEFFGVLETLEYLRKGGRIGKAQAFLGSLLNIKPVLIIKDGVVHPLERCRTRRKALDRIGEIAEGFAPLEEISILYATTPEDAGELAQRLGHLVSDRQVIMGRVGPVVGTYLGPGALGLALRRKG